MGISQGGDSRPAQDGGREPGIDAVLVDEFNCASQWSDHPDKSACAVETLSPDTGALGSFKTPGLRQIADTAPYMHTGTLEDLRSVVEFYNEGGHEDGFVGEKDDDMVELNLSDAEIDAIVVFLETLNGDALDAQWLAP